MRFQCLQHVPFEGPGIIADWMSRQGHVLEEVRLYAGEHPRNPAELDGAVIMGGPMNVYQESRYPWLQMEKSFLDSMLHSGKYLIGICLGAQLLANVLGAEVYPNSKKEIGWFPINKTQTALQHPLLRDIPDTITVYHWHGDTFDLPEHAIHLFENNVCSHQGFLFGNRVIGLQCHLEITPAGVRSITTHCEEELHANEGNEYIQSADIMMEENRFYNSMHQVLESLLDAWLGERGNTT